MSDQDWQPTDATTYQDHVIAHVVGASTIAYFILDEALYLLLDIGFVWTIFVDGQMTLLPASVAVSELEASPETRSAIQRDVDALLGLPSSRGLSYVIKLDESRGGIEEVQLYESGDRRRLLLVCEENNLAIETSVSTAEINIYDC